MTGNARAALLGLAAYALFATHDAIIKGLGERYAPFQILFFSVLLSFPLTTLYLMRDPAEGNLIPRHPWWMAARTAAVAVTGVSAFYAFSVLPLAQAYAIIFASPMLITVLSIPILGETVRLRRSLAVGVGLVGVLIVLRPGAVELGLGHAAALAAACGASFAAVVVRRIGREERSVVMLLYPIVANFTLMACVMPLVYEPMPLGDLGAMGAVAGLAFAATLLVIAAYRTGDPSVVAPMQYSPDRVGHDLRRGLLRGDARRLHRARRGGGDRLGPLHPVPRGGRLLADHARAAHAGPLRDGHHAAGERDDASSRPPARAPRPRGRPRRGDAGLHEGPSGPRRACQPAPPGVATSPSERSSAW